MPVGYMRVSSDWDQTTDLQRDALLWAGVGSRHRTNLAAGDTSVGSTPTSARWRRCGPRALADHELLRLLGIRTDRRSLAAAGGLRGLLDDPDGPPEAPTPVVRDHLPHLLALREILLRWMRSGLPRGALLTDPPSVNRYLSAALRGRPHEVFACLFLDARHRLIAYEELFTGNVTQAVVHVGAVARRALSFNAAALICAHNHPAGSALPSSSDLEVTARLGHALSLIDVELLDHVIVGDDPLSLAERGWMPPAPPLWS